jgi:hypothetical protein
VHRPQSDPSLRTSHPVRKSTAPLPMSPVALVPPAAIPTPDSTPSAKPPRVPFYDDDERARRARQEPTSLVSRPGEHRAEPPAAIAPASAARVGRKAPLFLLLGAALFGVVATAGVLVFVRGRPQAHATKPVEPAAASAMPIVVASTAPAAVDPPSPASAPPSASASASASASTSAHATERTVLSIDTVPPHATISINGEKKGKAPLELKLPKSSDEVVIEIQHPGYVTMKERVVPDVNQRLKLSLVASGAAKPAAAKPGSNNPYKKFE